jgi:hypothetical protein
VLYRLARSTEEATVVEPVYADHYERMSGATPFPPGHEYKRRRAIPELSTTQFRLLRREQQRSCGIEAAMVRQVPGRFGSASARVLAFS